MTVCTECQCVEPKTRELTEAECADLGISIDDAESVCAECDSLAELKHYDEDAGLDR